VKTLELSPSARYTDAQSLRDDLVRALRQLRGDRTGLSNVVPAVALIACPHCGEKTRADAPRCPNCGAVPRATGGQAGNSAKRPAPRPSPPNNAGRPAAPVATPRAGTPGAGAARQTYAPPARPAPAPPAPKPRSAPAQPAAAVIPAAAAARQTAAPAPQPAARPAQERAKPLIVDARTPAQIAFPTNGRGMSNGRATAVVAAPASVGALALAPAPPAPAIAVEQREAPKARQKDQPVAISVAKAPARPVAAASQPRSLLNLGGPELTSLGKGALALSVIEMCWGALVLALAIVEVAAQNSASKPYIILAGVWFALVIALSLIGGQLLTRPVHRRGRRSRRRRAFYGFWLVAYSLAVHAGGIWGIFVFSESRPNAPLAVVAFMIFAVNVFVGGIASVTNTLS
ncbi:MAG TPA: zinc ribbon domain-containing protein, partial [Ktedonobacterales bacterium]|nr:zinc ribbon domain-containing protein [Ktedonobacterales bacterium]